jgi:bacillithiol system protein YtxJ
MSYCLLCMSIFKRLFSSSEPAVQKTIDWHPLNDLTQISEVITRSYERTVVIFKHSTRCSISRFALDRFERDYHFTVEQMTAFYLDLIAFREISNEVSRKFGIEHQSPQIIVIKNGRAVFSASHESIDAALLGRFV